MRNVYKGYQVSKMAMPKGHMESLNKAFSQMHGPRPAHFVEKPPKAQKVPTLPKRPGKNKGF
jgi:hypothetical protein